MKKKQERKIKSQKNQSKKQISFSKTDQKFNYLNLVAIGVIIILGIIIYSNSFVCSFHFDDLNSIIDNEKIKTIPAVHDWVSLSRNRFVAYYSFAVNYHFNQMNVWGYHFVNLVIHLINSILVWWMTLIIFSTPALKNDQLTSKKNLIAIVVALLFVSHPLATQSVTYIVQRLTSMVAMFYLLSIVFYLKARLTDKKNNIKYGWYAGSLLAAVLALLTKENAYTLPFAILGIEFFFIRTGKIKFQDRKYRYILLMLGIIGFMVMATIKFGGIIFKTLPPTQGHEYTLTPVTYLFTQFSVIVKYVQLLVLPINQMVDYDFPIANHFFEARTFLSLLFLLAVMTAAVFLFRKYKLISFGIFWFFLTLSVESGFVPINDVIFEHRTYLPSVGFFIVLTAGIFILFRDKNKLMASGLFVIIIILNSCLTFQRNKVWLNDTTLWNDNIEKAPNIARPLYNRGLVFLASEDWDKAIDDYSKAIAINPNYKESYVNRAIAYANLKRYDDAIDDYSTALRIYPNLKSAYFNRGALYGNLKQWDKSIEDFSSAISIDPKYKEAYLNRGVTYGNIGDWTKAIDDFTKALEIDPNYELAANRRDIAYKNLKTSK